MKQIIDQDGSSDYRFKGHHHSFVDVENHGEPTGFYVCRADGCVFGYGPGTRWVQEWERRQLEGVACIDIVR